MLDAILAATRERLGDVVARLEDLRTMALARPAPRGFAHALGAPGLQVIAEIKRRSPSAGVMAADLDPVEQAVRYFEGGAAAISVLTEPGHFGGSLEDLAAVGAAVPLPVLRKDFILHPAQIWEARALGADAVLLIVAALDDDELDELYATATAAGLDALVEAHTEEEVRRAIALGAEVIGVNNRDLTTFVTDLATAERLAALLEGVAVTVAESGVSTAEGARRMAEAGFQAILVGEALVRSSDPAALIRELRSAGQ